MSEENTLEVHRLIIGPDEAESESDGTISEYLIERAALHGNKLGRNRKHVKEFDIVKDPYSEGWVMVFMCERWF
tara:strand:- start:447 stop:668 length:222 start_codon:yes stop_codon:yes gene_type:complete